MSRPDRPPIFSWSHGVIESSLPSQSKHLMLTLSCHMNSFGEGCFPSIDTLARETGYARATVIKYLRIAREAGWITTAKHGYGNRKWRRNEYRIAWPQMFHVARGGSPDEPPKPDQEEQAGSPGEPPETQKGGSCDEPPEPGGGSRGEHGAVHGVNSNTPGNTTPHAPAHAREAMPDGVQCQIPMDWWPADTTVEACRMRGFPDVLPETVAAFIGHYTDRMETASRWEGLFLKWMANQKVYDAERSSRAASFSRSPNGGSHGQESQRGGGSSRRELLESLERDAFGD